MKILVTGANGQLGHCLRDEAGMLPHEFIYTDVEELDITDADAVERLVRRERPDILINCAAYTDVEGAESHPLAARRLNAEAPGILARAMQHAGGCMIHVSTDYVFGAAPLNTPASETTPEAPAGVYGLTKLEGEKAVCEACDRYVIVRTAWLYSEYGRNFMLTMRRLTAERHEVNVVFDQTGTPTYARDLARTLLAIAADLGAGSTQFGIYHYSGEGVCSWYDFALAIARACGNDACRVLPCHSSDFPSKVTRPAYSVLDKTKIKQTFGVSVPHWHDSLLDCMDHLKS